MSISIYVAITAILKMDLRKILWNCSNKIYVPYNNFLNHINYVWNPIKMNEFHLIKGIHYINPGGYPVPIELLSMSITNKDF